MILFSAGPGLARALPSLRGGNAHAEPTLSPSELKLEAIRLQPLSGMSKRECAREFGRGWSTVKGWLNPLALDRNPPERFVRWLLCYAEANALVPASPSKVGAL